MGYILFLFSFLPSGILATIIVILLKKGHAQLKRPIAIGLIFAFLIPFLVNSYYLYGLSNARCGWACGLFLPGILGIVTVSVPLSFLYGYTIGYVIDWHKAGKRLWHPTALVMQVIIIFIALMTIYVALPKDPSIEFYGRLVDQHGNPVADVEVAYTVYHSLHGELHFKDRTGPDGTFVLTHRKGREVRIMHFEKTGYDFQLKKYAQHNDSRLLPFYPDIQRRYIQPDLRQSSIPTWDKTSARRPIVYHAWKRGEPVALIFDTKSFGFQADDRGQVLRLPETAGAIKVRFLAEPKRARSNRAPWAVTIDLEGGGIMETNDPFLYEAPASGYQANWSFYCRDERDVCGHHLERQFYLKARNGQVYGALMIEFRPYYNDKYPLYMSVAYWLNPKASRSLLYDRSKEIPQRQPQRDDTCHGRNPCVSITVPNHR